MSTWDTDGIDDDLTHSETSGNRALLVLDPDERRAYTWTQIGANGALPERIYRGEHPSITVTNLHGPSLREWIEANGDELDRIMELEDTVTFEEANYDRSLALDELRQRLYDEVETRLPGKEWLDFMIQHDWLEDDLVEAWRDGVSFDEWARDVVEESIHQGAGPATVESGVGGLEGAAIDRLEDVLCEFEEGEATDDHRSFIAACLHMVTGPTVRAMRSALGMTQSEFADWVGVHGKQLVSDWERGVKDREPGARTKELMLVKFERDVRGS